MPIPNFVMFLDIAACFGYIDYSFHNDNNLTSLINRIIDLHIFI